MLQILAVTLIMAITTGLIVNVLTELLKIAATSVVTTAYTVKSRK